LENGVVALELRVSWTFVELEDSWMLPELAIIELELDSWMELLELASGSVLGELELSLHAVKKNALMVARINFSIDEPPNNFN
jgi:hypothetical protein